MSRVQILKDSRQSPSVKFLEFTRVVSKDKVAIMFEGEDAKYYSIRINAIHPDLQWASINCGGKDNVLQLREDIRNHPNYYNAPCLFFVDSDFDNNEEIANLTDLYLTPCYSIENLYFTESAFTRILDSEFKVSETNERANDFQKALSTYRNTKEEYLSKISGFNYLIKEIRRIENEGSSTGKLHINNLSFNKLLKVDLDKVDKIYNENQPEVIFPKIKPNLDIKLSNSRDYFSNISLELWFRGKQHLEFFRNFLVHLINDINSKTERKVFSTKSRVGLNLTTDNCVSDLSQYADTPPCLINFLKRQNFSA